MATAPTALASERHEHSETTAGFLRRARLLDSVTLQTCGGGDFADEHACPRVCNPHKNGQAVGHAGSHRDIASARGTHSRQRARVSLERSLRRWRAIRRNQHGNIETLSADPILAGPAHDILPIRTA